MRDTLRRVGLILAAQWLLGFDGMPLALAQEPAATETTTAAARIAALEEKIGRMDERLALLESRQGETSGGLVAAIGAIPAAAVEPRIVPATLTAPVGAPPPLPPQVPAAAYVAAGPEGFSIQSPEGDFRLRFRYQVHVDGRFGVNRNERTDPNTFYVRRTQPILEGTLYQRFDYHVLTDFSQGRARLVNAFVDANLFPSLSVRVGRFKGPVGLERLRSGMALALMERALPSQLVPNRDIGVQFSGNLARERLSYEVGVFNGVPDGGNTDGNTDDHKEILGRLMTQPFANSSLTRLAGLTFGVGGSYGDVEGNSDLTNLEAYSSTGGNEFFKYRDIGEGVVIADGVHYRLSPQGYYYVGPFGLMAEYVQSVQEVRRGTATATMNHSSWQVMSSYVLTGDAGSYSGVNPDRPFDPDLGHWGALELGARYTALTPDAEAFPIFSDPQESAGEAKAWALALTWYLNRNVKLVFGYEQTRFEAAAPGVTFDTEKIFQQRFQLRF